MFIPRVQGFLWTFFTACALLISPGAIAATPFEELRQERAALLAQPPSITRHEREAELVVREIRFAMHGPGSAAERQAVAVAALDTIERLLAIRPDGVDLAQLEGDRLLALMALDRDAAAADAYGELVARGQPLRPYVHDAGGAALLASRRPEEAGRAYAEALAQQPDNDDVAIGYFYALVESERLDEAVAFARGRFQEAEPAESRYLLWGLMFARGLAYSNRLGEASKVLDDLELQHPESDELLALRGTLLRWQDRPGQAAASYRQALAAYPRMVSAQLGLAGLAGQQGRLDDARATVAALQADHPTNAEVARFERDLALDAGWRLSLRTQYGDSASTVSPLGSEDTQTVLRAESVVLAEGFRAWLQAGKQEVELARQSLDFEQQAVGFSYQLPNTLLQLGYASGTGDADGIRLNADYRASDAWSFALAYEEAAWDVPLRARELAIGAEQVSLSARYAFSYEHALSAQAQVMDFTDGNRRRSLGLGWNHLWLENARWRIKGGLFFYGSDASQIDRPYFNPEQDVSADYSIGVDHLGWRLYERAFYQRVSLAVGSYRQEGFDSGSVIAFEYGHRWRFAPRTELAYGVTWRERPYDGVDEARFGLFASIDLVLP